MLIRLTISFYHVHPVSTGSDCTIAMSLRKDSNLVWKA